jgi:hypothetical protein
VLARAREPAADQLGIKAMDSGWHRRVTVRGRDA